MIEENRHTARTDVDSHAIPQHQSVWVIYFEAISVYECRRERPKRTSSFECVQGVIEVSASAIEVLGKRDISASSLVM
jgi:hypothetical protein